MPGTPGPVGCGSYHPGHSVHVIQALRAHRAEEAWHAIRIVEVRDDGLVIAESDDLGPCRWWHHEPDRLRAMAMGPGLIVEANPPWSLLHLRQADRWPVFSVCRPEDARPCLRGDGPDDVLDLLDERGGFLMSPDELLARLDRADGPAHPRRRPRRARGGHTGNPR